MMGSFVPSKSTNIVPCDVQVRCESEGDAEVRY